MPLAALKHAMQNSMWVTVIELRRANAACGIETVLGLSFAYQGLPLAQG
ncbi:hypothetical protein [Anaerovibrio sp. JC8]|nr:hypothetical protein [Anaerovibrio sp. JC8]